MTKCHMFLVILVQMTILFPACLASNILMFPFALGVNSRLMNMHKMGDQLADHGHNVTMLINSRTRYIITSKKITVVEYLIPPDRKVVFLTDPEFQDIFANKTTAGDEAMDYIIYDYFYPFYKTLFEQKTLIELLKSQHFDLFLLDAIAREGHVLADYFGIPALLYSNYGYNGDSTLFHPSFPSFVPIDIRDFGLVDGSDKMDFLQRLDNFRLKVFQQRGFFDRMENALDLLKAEYGFGKADQKIWCYRYSVVIATMDFALETPRPLMPNIIPISGLFLEDPKPLSGKWKAIMDSAHDEGVIIISFGSIMSPFSSDMDKVLAKVFASLPQTVIWKHPESHIEGQGNNTHLDKWLPQNDLLAHPKVKLFITHCGVSSTYETIQHAVPVLALPAGIDQSRNSANLVYGAQMGIQLDIKELNEEIIRSTISQVLGNDSYRRNAKKMSELLRDKPLPAKELFLFWVDYVIRHKGAPHLISEAANELNFVQYRSLDVIGFLVAVTVTILTITIAMLCCCLKVACRLFRVKWILKSKSD